MARRERKRSRNESRNSQEAQEQQSAEINAEKPQLLNNPETETESTQLPKDPPIQMLLDDKEVEKIEDNKEGNEPNQFHHHVLTPIDSNTVLVPESEPFVVVKDETNGLSADPDSTTPRKKKRKRKGKSLLTSEGGAATNDVKTDLGLLSPIEPVAEKNDTNQLCIGPESTPSRKKKRRWRGKSVSTSEGTEINNVNSQPLSHDGFSQNQSQLLPESEPVAEKNEESNKLFTEPESATPRKKKRKGKGKGKNVFTSEGIETNVVNSEQRELLPDLDPLSMSTSEGADTKVVNSEQCELISNLDLLTPKDSDSGSVLLPQPESFAEKNGTNQLCTEPESATPRKKRKGKKKSLSKSEVVEINHLDSEHRELCPNLAALPPKEADPLLLPEPAPVGEKNEANQLCTAPDSISPKFEGAEIKDMGSENFDLCPKLDPLPHNDPDPLLLPESVPAPTGGVGQKKKRKNKKNKGELKGEGVESNRPNDEHSQQCHKPRPTTPEDRNQRKRKRQVMNETHDSSVQSMVAPCMLNSEAVGRRPRISGRPLKDYERYEVCEI